ncbi:MAG: hypothetical protein HIU86_11475 [Acidobacteria bacterium]|nr:hypothetical protein [Acidobacteriota bacterium]
MRLNDAAGSVGLAAGALAPGVVVAGSGSEPGPFLLGAAFIGVGLGLSVAGVREARSHVQHEAAARGPQPHPLTGRGTFLLTIRRDSGFAVGAPLAGLLADAFGMPAAILVVAAATAGSGILVAIRMRGDDHLGAAPRTAGGAPTLPAQYRR